MGLIATVRALLSTNELADKKPTDLRTDREGALWVHLRDMLVQAAGAVGTARAEATIAPTTGGLNVHVVGGSISGGGSADATPSTAYSSSALEASAVLKASAGTFRSLLAELDASAPTGTYYVQVLVAAAVPTDGTVTHLRPPQRIDHINGTTDRVVFDEGDAGITFATGCCAVLSTTRWTKTASGSYCAFAGSVL